MTDYMKYRKGKGKNPEDRNQVPEDQPHSVDEFLLFGDDEELHRHNPPIQAGLSEDQDGVRFAVLERAVSELAYEFYKSRDANKAGSGAHPRIEVLVDTNCLVTFTGPIGDFDKDYFRKLLDQTIRGRLALEDCKVEEELGYIEDETPYIG